MAAYSASDKFLHKFYLSNYIISKATLEMDEILNGTRAKKLNIDQYVFVTGLARSGTTSVMRTIFQSGSFASLQYSNMPFLLSPNLWKKSSKIESHERAHKDGIVIDGNSPEEFDEYFWKAFLKDSYIAENGLLVNDISKTILEKYKAYVRLICLAKGKERYISKNNNNVLRIDALRKIKGSILIILFRDPLSHASSLLKLHKSFSKSQAEDPFTLEYFNYLGHHEFGLNHKPFLLTKRFKDNRTKFSANNINYWLMVWLNYYSYLLEKLENKDILICFEELISSPDSVYPFLSDRLNVHINPGKKHKPSNYTELEVEESLHKECISVYNALFEKKSS